MRGKHRSVRRTIAWSTALAVMGATAVGCSDGDTAPDVAVTTGPTAPSTDTTTSAESVVTTAGSVAPPTTVPAAETTTAALDTIATVPEQGVPGIDSADPFCRGWSEFAGTFQALAASSVTEDPTTAARLEVVASGALLAAVDAIDGAFPVELASEREAFVDGLLGPLTRRAEGAADALLDAGLTAADVDRLAATWLSALAAAGVAVTDVVVEIPDDLAAGVDAATAAFSSAAPPIAEDPGLITDATAPLTEAYIAGTCPDQGILGGNDATG